MFDTPLVEIALGLMLVFVLFSLLVSAVQEMIVAVMHSRSAALWDGIEMLLGGGDTAKAARTRLYAHPLIRSLVPPTSFSRHKPGTTRRSGPSYIPSDVFAKALIDLLRRPNAVLARFHEELRSAATALQSGDATAAGRVVTALDTALEGLPKDSALAARLTTRVEEIRQQVAAGRPLAEQAATVLGLLPADWKAELAENASAVSAELSGAIATLTTDAAGGIDDARQAVERWFDQAMNGVSGWYKRWTMAVQLGVGVVLACALNVDTVHIVRELSANESLRRTLAAHAQEYANRGVLEQRAITMDPGNSGLSLRTSHSRELTLVLPADAAGQTVTVEPSARASVLTCGGQAVPDPAPVPGQPPAALLTCSVKSKELEARTKVTLAVSYTPAGGTDATRRSVDVFLIPGPEQQYDQIERALHATGAPIGWREGALHPGQMAGAGWPLLLVAGWLLTALAGSLGAPFWFDLLKRVSNLRASGPKPKEQERTTPA